MEEMSYVFLFIFFHWRSLSPWWALAFLTFPYMRFLSNFGCKIIFMCSVNFWHQQVKSPTHCLKEALVTWPNETVCYIWLAIWLHTGVSRAGFQCIFVQQCAILGFISFGLQCVFVNFSWVLANLCWSHWLHFPSLAYDLTQRSRSRIY